MLGVSKVSALKRTTEVVKHRDGGDNSSDHKSPGRTSYDAITLERGLTHDPEFEAWVNKVHPYSGDAAMDLANYKKELTLEMMNEKGHTVFRYFLHACWVSESTSLPEFECQRQRRGDRVDEDRARRLGTRSGHQRTERS